MAIPAPVSGAPDNSWFYRRHSLEELVEGATPLASVDQLLIDDLADDEADAFYAAIGA